MLNPSGFSSLTGLGEYLDSRLVGSVRVRAAARGVLGSGGGVREDVNTSALVVVVVVDEWLTREHPLL